MRNPLKRPGNLPPSAPAGGPALQLVGTAPAPTVAGDVLVAERGKRHAELMERRALRRADDAEAAAREATARLDRVELELAGARLEARGLGEKLEQAQRRCCEAEQLAHSERSLRLELGRDHAERLERDETDARAALDLLEDAQGRAIELARQVAMLRRAVQETGEPDLARESLAVVKWPSMAQRPPAGGGAVRALRQEPAGAVAPDRLAAALLRLRQESPRPAAAQSRAVPEPRPLAAARSVASPPLAPDPPVAAPQSVGACWLEPPLKRLLRESPETAGMVVVALLPAQSMVAGPVRYDLALGDAGCLAVTVLDGEVRIEHLSEPRPLDEVAFRVEGDLAGLGRLLMYGRLRRRLSRRVARVRGDRAALRALEDLVRVRVGLLELDGAGLRIDPWLTFTLVASVIDPSWTRGERFTVGHESRGGENRAYLLVRDGEPTSVLRKAPLGPVATTIRCHPDQLLTLLAGGSAAEVSVLGATAPVALLREWVARAQRGA